MLRLAKRYRFSASHRLHSLELSDEANAALYGKCNNPFGHGHDYLLEVVLTGDPDQASGVLVPLSHLDRYVRQTVLSDFDHKYMNEQIPVFRSIPPTTENVASEIHRRLAAGWESEFGSTPHLETVRIFETRRNMVEFTPQ